MYLKNIMVDPKVKLTVLLPSSLRKAAKAKAKAEDTTVSQWIRRQIREWVKDLPDQKKIETES